MERYREAAFLAQRGPSFRLALSSNQSKDKTMDCYALTRALIDLDSTTGKEKPVVDYLFAHLGALATGGNGKLERMKAAPDRDNLLLMFGEPTVTLSTHMDTVPPYFSSSEDGTHIRGRGACDAKGIIAAMIGSAESLVEKGARNFALLFVVGEERDSAGAKAAAESPRGSRFLINGEPTQNRPALMSKGALRDEIPARRKVSNA